MPEFLQNYGFFVLVLIAMAICHLGHGQHGGHGGSDGRGEDRSARKGGPDETGRRQ